MAQHNRYQDNEYVKNNVPTAIVTGIAPLSLGESIALNLKEQLSDVNIITISRKGNESLEKKLGDQGIFIEFDLNPLNYGDGESAFEFFEEDLNGAIYEAFEELARRGKINDKSVFGINNIYSSL